MANVKHMTELNAVKLLQESLVATLKPQLERAIMDELIEGFKAKAEPSIKKEVERISLLGIEKYQDMMSFRDEFKVYLKWEGENE